jgi:NAD(P)-dependent dehydrogenase (short-subunit alcohol dehydrogenase family)
MSLAPDDVRLRDRIAIVTGAALGIGAAIAESYARFGCDVALCDRNADALAETTERVCGAGGRVRSAVLDVRDADAVHRFVAELGEAWGHVDVLVNNAGGGFHAPFLDVSARGQDALVHENFTSVTHFVRAAVPRMPAGSGSIINLTSIEAHRAGPGYAVYSAMKAAVENLTKSLALELGARGIRVNCIAPDVIPTPGTGPFEVRTPLARAGHPDDVAGAALYLACDLSRFVTGTTLHVDGGNWAAGGWRRRADGSFEP